MGRGFNSQIIRREKSEIVQIVRPTVSPPPQKSPHACSLARTLVRVRRFRGVYTRAGSKRRFDVVNCEKGRHKVNTSASWLFRPRKRGSGCAPELPTLSPLFSIVCPAEEERVLVGPVMRAQSPSFGVASNGPVNILTAVLFAGAERADEHFGSLNDS